MSGDRRGSAIVPARLALTTALALLLAATLAPAGASAAYTGTYSSSGVFEPGGPAAFNFPHRIAADPTTGNILVADSESSRVEVFKPLACPGCAEFLTEFESPGPFGIAVDPSNGSVYTTHMAVNEIQELTVTGATGGIFKLSFEGQSTGWSGNGDIEAGSKEIKNVTTTSGTPIIEEAISGEGIPAGTTITAVEEGGAKLKVNNAATETKTSALSADLPYNASDSLVKKALEALSTIGAGNVSVLLFSGVYEVKFVGALGGKDVPQLACDASGLTPGGATCTLATKRQGAAAGAAKYDQTPGSPPTFARDLAFTSPAEGPGAEEVGSFGSGNGNTNSVIAGIAVAPNHDVLIGDPGQNKVERFSSAGAFVAEWNGSSSGSAFTNVNDIAVRPNGEVIVADRVSGTEARILRFASDGSGGVKLEPTPENNSGLAERVVLAADPATGDVFVSSTNSSLEVNVCQFSPANASLGCFEVPGAGGAFELSALGLAASGSASAFPRRLYELNGLISLFGGTPTKVRVFEEGVIRPPAPEVEFPAAGIEPVQLTPEEEGGVAGPTGYEAAFRGKVNPKGSELESCRFEYLSQAEYEAEGESFKNATRVPCDKSPAEIGPGESFVEVKATAKGLEPNTHYRVRLLAEKELSLPKTAVGEKDFTTPAAAPTIAAEKAWSVTDTTATLTATVKPNNTALTDCHFEFGTTTAYGHEVPCSPALPAINSPDEMQQIKIASLQGTFKLSFEGQATGSLAFNATHEEVETALDGLSTIGGAGGAVTVTGGPGDEAGSSPYVVTFEGALGSQDIEQLTVDSDLGNGGSRVETVAPGGFPFQVTADISNLDPGATYHFRLDASNGVGGLREGEDAVFTTHPLVIFPQRHYELVSAFDTNGVEVLPNLATANGDHYAYATFGGQPLPGAETGTPSSFRSSHNPDGSWSQQYVGAPTPGPGEAGSTWPYPVFSGEDLSHAAWGSGTSIDPNDQNGAEDTYLRNVGDGITWLSRDPAIEGPQTDPASCGNAFGLGPRYVSPDGSSVMFTCRRRLLPPDIATGSNRSLYEWHEGQVSLLGVRPGLAEGFANGSALGSDNNANGVGNPFVYGNAVTRSAVSRDGGRVVFESGASITSQRLYVRLDGKKTVEASASAPGAPPTSGPWNVNYWGADANDEGVFFTSASSLTPDSNAPDTPINPTTGAGGSADLYRYLVPADGEQADGKLIDLTPHPGGAGVTQVLDISEDGRLVYFAAKAALTPDAHPAERCDELVRSFAGTEIPGPCNLYLARLDGPTDETPELNLVAAGLIPVAPTSDGMGSTPEKDRQVSASSDGSVLAFRSADDLVPGRRTGGELQVYVYDAGRGELSCASCPPDGSAPLAWASLTPAIGRNGLQVGTLSEINHEVPHVRNVAADGTVFFETASSLLPADSNGRLSVYEWRGGKLRLISSGSGASNSIFGDISADGSTVFFSSADEYVRGVKAGITRIYAARVGPTPPEAEGAAPCTGEDCMPVATPQPNYAAPQTSTIEGRGNVVEKPSGRCPKGSRKIRRHGKVRCVRKHRRAHRRAASHHRRAAR